MKPFTILSLLILGAFACTNSSNKNEKTESNSPDLSDFQSSYYIVDQATKSIIEDCFTKKYAKVDFSEFAGSPGSYFLVINEGEEIMYEVSDPKMENGVLTFQGMPDVEMEFQNVSFKMSKNENGTIQLKSEQIGNKLLTKEGEEVFSLKKCDEYYISEPTEEDVLFNALAIYVAINNQDTEFLQKRITESGIITLHPGPGIHQIPDTIQTVEEILEDPAFDEDFKEIANKLATDDGAEEGYFPTYVGEGFDFCFPEGEGLFVRIDEEDGKITGAKSVISKARDDYFESLVVIEFVYNEKNHFKITVIDVNDCGA